MTKHGLSLCVVCEKPLLDNNDCFSMGSDGYRHKKCKPGSSAWVAKYGESEISKMLSTKKTRVATSKVADPIRQAIKEFCGRDKYMRYMNTVNKFKVGWVLVIEVAGSRLESSDLSIPPDAEDIYAKLTTK